MNLDATNEYSIDIRSISSRNCWLQIVFNRRSSSTCRRRSLTFDPESLDPVVDGPVSSQIKSVAVLVVVSSYTRTPIVLYQTLWGRWKARLSKKLF